MVTFMIFSYFHTDIIFLQQYVSILICLPSYIFKLDIILHI